MALKQQIQKDLIEAMKAKDEIKLSALRMLKAAMLKFEVDKGINEMGDTEILTIIGKELKQRRDAADQFRNGNRMELAEKEEKEAVVLQAYMPPQLSEEEVVKLAKEAIAETSAVGRKDMGKVMAALMPKVKGMADGTLVNKVVGALLGS